MQNYNSKFKILARVFLICLIFHFSFFIFHLDKAEASALSLSIDPPIIEIHAVPPSRVVTNLTIQNKSDSEVELMIHLKPFKASLENGQLEYLSLEDKDTSLLLRNVQILDNNVPVDSLILGPTQQRSLGLNINIPQDLNISDYYFSIIFISKNTLTIESTASLNQLGIATNILLSVGTKETPKATLEEFSSPILLEKGPVDFVVRVKNKGNHFIKPKGMILIKNMFGQTIGKLDLPKVNILSDSTRKIPETTWKEDFILGLYTANLNLSLSDEGPTFTKSIHFFAFPLQILIWIIIMTIGAIIIYSRLKRYMKR